MELETHSIEHWLLSFDEPTPAPTQFSGLDALGKALALSALHRSLQRPIVALFNSNSEARNVIDNFRFFSGTAAPIHYIPILDFDYHRNLLPTPQDTWTKNTSLFHLLNDTEPALYVTTVTATLQKCLSPERFLAATVAVRPGAELPRGTLLQTLARNGYQMLPNVSDPGSYAVRGGIVDVFCPLYRYPIRLEYLGDFVETLRFFEPDTQRSREEIPHATLIPVISSPLPDRSECLQALNSLKSRLDSLGFPKSDREELLLKLQEQTWNQAFDRLFPLIWNGSSNLWDYFPPASFIVSDGNAVEAARELEFPKLQAAHTLHEKEGSPIAELHSLVVQPTEFGTWFDTTVSSRFTAFGEKNSILEHEPLNLGITATRSQSQLPLEQLSQKLRNWMDLGYRIQIACHTQLHAERLSSLLGTYHIPCERHLETEAAFPTMFQCDFQKLHVWHGFTTHSGFYPGLKLVVLSEEAVFGKKKRTQSGRKSSSPHQGLATLRSLVLNDYVVHKDHGIGRYLGLQSRDFLGIHNDYVVIEYKDSDKLYVPIYRLNVIQKYASGDSPSPTIDKLGGDRWLKTKSKAQKAVAELAAQFLDTHAKRRLIPATPCPPIDLEYEQFEMEFPFDETPDQLRAINEINLDLERTFPMNRLLCGDVGYGKTEIAMRAAFRVAASGKQIAVLVPTTILAFQHLETFSKRFNRTAIRVEMISRLRTAPQIRSALNQVSEGKIDIIIGTHRLLSSDFSFKNLGMVIVDEEHRFGVLHKERLKKICETVHVLSMTATPIPRTLNMAMSGITDVSIITTPPPDRLSVRTYVSRHTEEIIREAISNELSRNGQVYYVHNRIETINEIADEMRTLFPSLRFQVVHGQLDPEELERSMIGFFQNDFQVLVTTAIVESGLDNPRANTILIDRADHFGLAQLYQLRGRVGRADRRAYCYLLVPGESQITPDSKQRLQIMQQYSELGSGFQIASHDLDTRGAGDLLGQQQSGHLNSVGTELYFELLEGALSELQGKPKAAEVEPEINLRIPAYFPESYLPDISERVNVYRRLSAQDSVEAISELETELRDRFGPPPLEVTNLLGLMYLKLRLKHLHVLRMSCGPKRTSLQFAPTTPASPEKLVQLIQMNSKTYALTPDHKLVFESKDSQWKSILGEIEALALRLGVTA